ncbi:Two-component sensor histidine kinase, contains HisKA and HATPase domains [Bradyrhizobium sp. Rc2d]|nr:Two-component sensor histidine kinase, contains HisKA and HATPase domains [Bradyrhizobium sp. Rc2d]
MKASETMQEVGDQPVGRARQIRSPLIIGVGASPTALDSIERFFAKLTVGADQAVVLALRHHEGLDEPRLREILQNSNAHKVFGVSDGETIEGGTIYLCPPAMITTIQGGRFAIRKAEHAPGERLTIDSFLVSLAEEREQAIGVILSGTGGDGTLGTATLKDHGGLAIVEEVTSEESDHLQEANTPAAIADYVLPPQDIPEHIQVYARHLRRLDEKQGVDDLTNEGLKSSNQEYRSLKEELQSVNEKLTTVNGELAHRVQELTRATSDLKNFLESTQIATIFLDNDLRVMNFTPAITQVLHLVETDTGRPITHIKARIPIEELYDDIRRVLRTLASVERELSAPDSGTRYIVRILPYRSIDNFIAGVVITFIDVTAITRAEERQRLLLAELQHRVRNTLGVVRSIARRSAETSTTVEEYASHLDGRLNAYARTQALVTRDPEGGVDLEYLVVEELLAYNAREGEQMRVSGPKVRFQPKAAETFALALHELATNALKYGALSQSTGRIEITWRLDESTEPAELVFEWRERGGPPVKPPARKAFGIEILERTLAFEFKGQTTLTFSPAGLQCTITIPLSKRTFHTPMVAD